MEDLSTLSSVMISQPVGKYFAILFVGIYGAHVAGMAEQMPTAARDILIKRCGDNGCANIARPTADERWLGYLVQLVGIPKSNNSVIITSSVINCWVPLIKLNEYRKRSSLKMWPAA